MHRIEDAESVAGKWARAIALKRGVVVAVLASILGAVVMFGWITPEFSGQVESAVATGFTFLTAIATAFAIKPAVTPADQALQPVNSDGELLVPDTSIAEALEDDEDPSIGAALYPDATT